MTARSHRLVASGRKRLAARAALACALALLPLRAAGQAPGAPFPASAATLARAITPGVARLAPLDPVELRDTVDAIMTRGMKEMRVPGAVVAVVQDGRVLLLRGYGYAELASRRPVDPERTLFRVGSVSKPFTAAAVLQLVERGRLDPDADVNRYLRAFRVPATFPEPITAAQLLTHRGGLDVRLNGTAAATEAEVQPLGRYLAAELPPRVRPPGRELAYSNQGYALLGHLVEAVSGEEFAGYMARHVLGPLGMSHSTFRFTPAVEREAAVGYEPTRHANRVAVVIHPNIAPAAGLSTTGADMTRFMLWQLEGSAAGGAVLADSTLRWMQAQHYTPDPRMPGVAFGLFESYFRGQRLLSHSGGIHGFMSAVYLWPDQHLGLFVADNGYQAELVTLLLTKLMRQYFPYASPVPIPPPGTLTRTERLAGSYRPLARARRNLEKAGGIRNPTLEVLAGNDGSLSVFGVRMLEMSPGWYRQIEGDELVAFQPVAGGGMRMVTSYPWEGTEVWERVPWWQTTLPNQLLLSLTFLFSIAAIASPVPWVGTPSIRGRDRPRTDATPVHRLARAAASMNLAVIVLPFIGILAAGPAGLLFGVPWEMDASGVLAIGSALMIAPLALVAARARGDESWSIGERLALGLFLLLQLLFVLQLAYWNLLGIRH